MAEVIELGRWVEGELAPTSELNLFLVPFYHPSRGVMGLRKALGKTA